MQHYPHTVISHYPQCYFYWKNPPPILEASDPFEIRTISMTGEIQIRHNDMIELEIEGL